MTARWLDGKALAQARRHALSDRVQRLQTRGITPHLGVILPTADEAAAAYFRAKQRIAEKIGLAVTAARMDAPTTADLVEQVKRWGRDPEISGILIEAPLPEGIDMGAVRDALPASKDVDGAGTESLGRLLSGEASYAPATAAAARALAPVSYTHLRAHET